jgi:DNA-binding IclR family transcriptional regulator
MMKGTNSKVPPWWDLLQTIRAIGRADRTFTSEELAERTGLEVSTASAWLCKMARWNYVRKVGATKGQKRWRRLFELTDLGRSRKSPRFTVSYRPRGT